jgi:hypothetical protein
MSRNTTTLQGPDELPLGSKLNDVMVLDTEGGRVVDIDQMTDASVAECRIIAGQTCLVRLCHPGPRPT